MKIARADDRWCLVGFERVVHGCLEGLALRHGYRVGAVCDDLKMSESYLRELFLRDLGLTPKEWMRWERMVVARRLLVWGRGSLEVAEALGFSGMDSFRREFRTVYGVLPKHFMEMRLLDFA